MRASQAKRQRAARFALGAYLAVLLGLTFFPFSQLGEGEGGGRRLNLRPFATIGPALDAGPGTYPFALFVGNIAAFMPLGALLPVALPQPRSALMALGAGLLLSATIETGQYALSTRLTFLSRQADIDDVLLNTTGALAGYAVLVALTRWGIDRSRG